MGRGTRGKRDERSLEELLGHVRTATLVDDVSHGKKTLEGNDHADEETHAGSGGCDDCERAS